MPDTGSGCLTVFRHPVSAEWRNHEILELILFSAIPRRDVKPLAKKLLLRFGSVAAVLDAEKNELLNIAGIGERTVAQLRLYREIVTLYVGQTKVKRETLNSGRAVADFARVKLGGSRYENFMVVFLNTQNKLIDFDVTQGTVNRATVYPRNIAKRRWNFMPMRSFLLTIIRVTMPCRLLKMLPLQELSGKH